MHLLILGGTLFLGRHLVEAALERGHVLTLFHRGQTHPQLYPDLERIQGDRTTDLERLAGRSWHAVIDTCGYLPRVVRASAAALRDACEHYTFISSISVYASPVPSAAEEDAPLAEIDESQVDEFVPERYGALKALCEQAALQELPGRALVVRSGLLVGRYDPTGRLGYWTRRIAEGGEVLAPGSPSRAVQLIHARDMAEWILDQAEQRVSGTYNVTGPAEPISMGTLLESVRAVSRSDARLTWVAEAFLQEQGVSPWTELPLWLPEAWNGMLEVSIARALATGLSFRSLEAVLREVLDWSEAHTEPAGMLASGAPTAGFLSRAREAELLDSWARSRVR